MVDNQLGLQLHKDTYQPLCELQSWHSSAQVHGLLVNSLDDGGLVLIVHSFISEELSVFLEECWDAGNVGCVRALLLSVVIQVLFIITPVCNNTNAQFFFSIQKSCNYTLHGLVWLGKIQIMFQNQELQSGLFLWEIMILEGKFLSLRQ